MRYVIAKYAQYRQELTYRIYITDSLFYQGANKRLTTRYADILEPVKKDTRTGDEIAQDIIKRLGLNT